jgi:hypothetical protein
LQSAAELCPEFGDALASGFPLPADGAAKNAGIARERRAARTRNLFI